MFYLGPSISATKKHWKTGIVDMVALILKFFVIPVLELNVLGSTTDLSQTKIFKKFSSF